MYPFHGAAGSGLWHDIKGYAEDIFPQCRQYDITTNKIVDGINMEMMVALKGMSADQTRKLKQMEWGRYFVMPEDVDFVQKGIQLPIRDAVMTNQVIMGDKDRSTANYNMVSKSGNQTAREAELNFAQQGKLDGTQLRRYNLCQTNWQRGLYDNLVKCKAGWKGYDCFEVFRNYLKRHNVPDEAWKSENIEYFDSNFISVAGANKIVALQQVVGIAAGQSINEGEDTAKRMLVSALIGRQNVDAVLPPRKKDFPDQARVISFENAGLNDPDANPENFPVHPDDNQLEHIRGHFSDAMETATQALQWVQQGIADADYMAQRARVLALKGGHITRHIQILESDPSKKQYMDAIGQSMQQLQKAADEVMGIATEMAKAKQEEQPQKTEEELELEFETAKAALALDFQKQKDQQKLAITALKHEQKTAIDKEKAANSIAIKRAEAASKLAAERAAKFATRIGGTPAPSPSPEQVSR